jgi:succinate-semialdehyde dehydrogenase/glutarate-semialdehyde dehydrogenase
MNKSINPYNQKEIQSYPTQGKRALKSIINEADTVFQDWRLTSIKERAQKIKKAGKILLKNKKIYAELISLEMGKPIREAISEIEKCAKVCEFYAAQAPEFLKNRTIKTEAEKSFVTYQPLGVILAVMPWNFPFWQVFRFAAPTLMAGNTAILKHASNVSGCALKIQEIFEVAGVSVGAFTTVLTSSKNVASMIENPMIKAVSLTGSGPAGSAVAETAGKNLKKSLLELGGNDAYLVLEDADLPLAVKKSVESRMINAGQSCIGAKRIIVIESIYDQFLKMMKAELKNYKIGDPRKKETKIGPMARMDLRDEVHDQVTKSIEAGAELVLGGKIPKRKGAFYPVTLLSKVKSGMPAFEDEIFGPVVSLISAKNTEEAIAMANDSDFGLGAAVFSTDIKQAQQIAAERLEAGSVAVNDFVRSNPYLPFGGIKQSGFGRELSREGILEFVNVKTVVVA